jgi:hypothetical protein
MAYDETVAARFPFLHFPHLFFLLLGGMIAVNGKKTDGHVLFALIANFIAGYVIENGSTWDEQQLYFFMGMAFYFAMHVNLVLYFIKVNPGWKTDLRKKPVRVLIPAILWLVTFFILLPDLPAIAVGPVFIYSGIYVFLVAMSWNLDRYIADKKLFCLLLAGTVFLLLSDTLLGFVLVAKVKNTIIRFPDMLSIVFTWNVGVVLVFYSLMYIQTQFNTEKE